MLYRKSGGRRASCSMSRDRTGGPIRDSFGSPALCRCQIGQGPEPILNAQRYGIQPGSGYLVIRKGAPLSGSPPPRERGRKNLPCQAGSGTVGSAGPESHLPREVSNEKKKMSCFGHCKFGMTIGPPIVPPGMLNARATLERKRIPRPEPRRGVIIEQTAVDLIRSRFEMTVTCPMAPISAPLLAISVRTSPKLRYSSPAD